MNWYDNCLSLALISLSLLILLYGNVGKIRLLEAPRNLPSAWPSLLIVAGLVAIVVWQVYLLFFR